jgi:hypothetical protein
MVAPRGVAYAWELQLLAENKQPGFWFFGESLYQAGEGFDPISCLRRALWGLSLATVFRLRVPTRIR